MCAWVEESERTVSDFDAFAEPAILIRRWFIEQGRRMGVARNGGVDLRANRTVSIRLRQLMRLHLKTYPVRRWTRNAARIVKLRRRRRWRATKRWGTI